MAWTTPKTWSAGGALIASDFNTHIRDNLLALKNPSYDVKNVNEASDYTTTSTTWVDIDATDLSITITTYGSDVRMFFYGNVFSSTASVVFFTFVIDGTTFPADDGAVAVYSDRTTAPGRPFSFSWRTDGLAAGSHQFKVAWKTNTGTATLLAGAGTVGGDFHPQFGVEEVS